ncbi:asparaginase [Sanguibacter antarcticus]|uniref:L-asparaginase n=1 Tax=Sanguibacter antarcticus TaxID=372484 RepID=A0A2A9E6Z2_9MICO|nr:asparaginase [Sanguibacter antarcticus]PFG34837.1 L-asparaginase [Sanguibacter antarcticus]
MLSSPPLRRVRLITLGGTISSEPAGPGPETTGRGSSEGLSDGPAGVVPRSGAGLFQQEIQHWVPGVELVPLELRMVPSPSLTMADLLALHAAIAGFGDDVDGVVVSQGTDTIEETAFVLDVLGAAARVPVVVTGAMRDRTTPGADGAANLVAAALVAASPDARGAGVLVQIADRTHAARWVTKRSTFRVDGFSSEPFGPVGAVVEGVVHLGGVPRPRPALPVPTGEAPRVAVVVAGLGDDLALLPGLADAGYDGVVIAGAGGGHVAASAVENVAATVARIPVVMCSRVGSGPALTQTYGYPGGEIDLARVGTVPGGGLSAPKARMLLMLLVASGATPDEVRDGIVRYGRD